MTTLGALVLVVALLIALVSGAIGYRMGWDRCSQYVDAYMEGCYEHYKR